MLCFNGVPDKVASFVLLCIMIGATYTHHVANEPVFFSLVYHYLRHTYTHHVAGRTGFFFLVYHDWRHTYTHHVAGEPLGPYYFVAL